MCVTLSEDQGKKVDTWCIIVTEAVTLSTLLAVASLYDWRWTDTPLCLSLCLYQCMAFKTKRKESGIHNFINPIYTTDCSHLLGFVPKIFENWLLLRTAGILKAE